MSSNSEDYAGAGDDRAVIDLNRQAIRLSPARQSRSMGSTRDFFDPAGKVNGAASEAADAHNRSYAAHLASLGEGSSEIARRTRPCTRSPGSAPLPSPGLYTPGTVMLQPAGYIRGLAAGLANGDGVAVHRMSTAR
jgi:glycine/D-amino acid oxidase-like deaminating enzyme